MRDKAAKSNALAKANLEAAINNPAISEYRRDRQTFKVVAQRLSANNGVLKAEDTGAVCGAVLLDFLSGVLDVTEAAVVSKQVDTVLKEEDQVIAREQMVIQLEMREMMSARLAEKKKALRSRV